MWDYCWVWVSLCTRSKLILLVAVAVALVVFSFWLMVDLGVWGSVVLLLQGCAVALVICAFFARGGMSVGLLEFVVKGFVVSLVLMIVLWFVSAWFGVSWIFYSSVLWIFTFWFGVRVLPFSLLSVAISVVAYGVFRRRLQAWVILLSSWYVSIFVVFAAYDLWWAVFVQPYPQGLHYSSGAGAILREMLLVFVAFLVACVFTAIYVGFRKLKQSSPP